MNLGIQRVRALIKCENSSLRSAGGTTLAATGFDADTVARQHAGPDATSPPIRQHHDIAVRAFLGNLIPPADIGTLPEETTQTGGSGFPVLNASQQPSLTRNFSDESHGGSWERSGAMRTHYALQVFRTPIPFLPNRSRERIVGPLSATVE